MHPIRQADTASVVGRERLRNRIARSVRRAALLVAAALGAAGAHAAEPLARLGANVSEVSVSGVSSGGYMAVQFHVAHSKIVHGAGVLAAGPYYCAQGSPWTAQLNCMQPELWAPVTGLPLIKSEMQTLAELDAIDAPSNLRRSKVWLFSGTKDETVAPLVVEALANFYRVYMPPSSIKLVESVAAGHAMVTSDYGGTCAVTAPPYLNDCNYDAAGELLKFIEGPLVPAAPKAVGRIVAFDQREFADKNPAAISMADTGYVYVPTGCDSKPCRVHVAFHGCRQSVEAQSMAFVEHAGYNR
jgi:poly(3-hydroxybutyrate) depolymerase